MNIDPVCGMEVKDDSPHEIELDGHAWHFCSAHCLEKFEVKPEQYTIDPVCGMHVKPESPHRIKHDDWSYRFCSEKCLHKFSKNPAQYINRENRPVVARETVTGRYTCPMHPEIEQDGPGSCPKCGMALEPMGVPMNIGKTEYTCPMHPEVVSDKPGSCPKCGMALEARSIEAEEDTSELDDMSRRLKVSTVLAVPVFILAMVADLVPSWLPSALSMGTVQWIEFALATPVVLWGGWPFFERFWLSVKTWNLNMFTLVGLGVGVAWIYSVVALLLPGIFPPVMQMEGANGERLIDVYFEAGAVITALVLLGQVLELRARSRTNEAIKLLLGMAPKTARRVAEDGSEADVPLEDVVAGDVLRMMCCAFAPVKRCRSMAW